MVRVWSFKKMEKCSKPLAADPTSLDWSSDGKWLAVGDRKATITILNAQTLEIVDSLSSEVSKEKALQMKGKNNFKTEQWIEVCRFSPNN
jgi:WD40 repeat protein